MIYPNNLKEIRLKKGFTLEQLEEATGVSKGQIWALENGNSQPRIFNAYKLAQALKVSVFKIWEREL